MNLPRITVVTPSYNSVRYIEQTLTSVLGQGYPDLEYLVNDGGSSDGTQEILRNCGYNIRWVSEKDWGQSDAINKGLRVASGDVVTWLNSNDVLLPGALSKVGEYFASHPSVDVIFGKAKLLSEQGKIIGDYEEVGPHEVVSQLMLRTNALSSGHYLSLLNYHPGWIPQMTAFWRTSLMRKAGYLDPGLHYAMDYEYWLRLGSKGLVHFIDEYLAGFRLHRDAKSTDAKRLWREILSVRRRYGGKFFCHIHWIFLTLAWKGLSRRLKLG
jgi:glycosyltransferase involved in cell wall biosynthesis